MLPLGGLLIALFASWTMSKTTMMKEVGINNPIVFKAWHFTLRFLAPAAIIAVLVNGLI
jgi:NSS family neurotransmitter:Na+ symporter